MIGNPGAPHLRIEGLFVAHFSRYKRVCCAEMRDTAPGARVGRLTSFSMPNYFASQQKRQNNRHRVVLLQWWVGGAYEGATYFRHQEGRPRPAARQEIGLSETDLGRLAFPEAARPEAKGIRCGL